ncbi:MAG: N-acetylmuramoyl-L-alanine amidase LytC [bacterium]|nr:N-acetylmuramoyl-L-alanine amidase LytC [bacterium]
MPEAQSSWFDKIVDFFRRLFGGGDGKPPEPPTPTPTPPEETGRFIAVDAGHGGTDTGAINSTVGINEKTVTLAISQKLKTVLENRGHRVRLTRSDDTFVELTRRAEIANNAGVEIFVSIHCNSAETSTAVGIETYHHTNSANGRVLATKIHEAMIAAFPTHTNRGVKSANFVVLRETQMPACLVETEFISNNQQARFLQDPANQQKIANAIADGMAVYFR